MTTANKLTFSRLILTPIGLAVLLIPSIPYNNLLGLTIFTLAMATDAVDGIVARKFNQISNIGIYFDSLIDKIIILLFFIYLQAQGIYPLWLLLAFVGREMFMDGFKAFAVSQNAFIPAKKSGKIKAILQSLSLFVGLIYLTITSGQLFGVTMPHPDYLVTFAYYSMLIAFIISIYGAYSLIAPNTKIFSE